MFNIFNRKRKKHKSPRIVNFIDCHSGWLSFDVCRLIFHWKCTILSEMVWVCFNFSGNLLLFMGHKECYQ